MTLPLVIIFFLSNFFAFIYILRFALYLIFQEFLGFLTSMTYFSISTNHLSVTLHYRCSYVRKKDNTRSLTTWKYRQFFGTLKKQAKTEKKENRGITRTKLSLPTTYRLTFLMSQSILSIFASVDIYLMLSCCRNNFSNTDIHSFSIYYIFGCWGRFIACRCPDFSSILQFFDMCRWKFNIIIIFHTIALTLQTSKVRSKNQYLMLKPLFLNSTSKLYDDRHLPQNRCFLLSPNLPYLRDGFLHPSHDFHSIHLSYCSHLPHHSDPFHIAFSHFWDQEIQHYDIYTSGSLKSSAPAPTT